MHRRNVDLPEPDGPIRQNTSRGFTSRSMPLRMCASPKDLCTASALTIGRPVVLGVMSLLRLLIGPPPGGGRNRTDGGSSSGAATASAAGYATILGRNGAP